MAGLLTFSAFAIGVVSLLQWAGLLDVTNAAAICALLTKVTLFTASLFRKLVHTESMVGNNSRRSAVPPSSQRQSPPY